MDTIGFSQPKEMAATAGEWESLTPAISGTTITALHSMGFTNMTPVQASAIPLFLNNKDVAAEAVTGSGKTLSFLVPVFEMLLRRERRLRKRQVGAMIVLPTRELANQVYDVALELSKKVQEAYENGEGKEKKDGNGRNDDESEEEEEEDRLGTDGKFSVQIFTGGVDVQNHIEGFMNNGGHIVVATPGRLEDLMGKLGSEFDCRELEVLVLDEADRLLEMGFDQTIRSILERLPKQRRTGLFSATQTDQVKDLIRAGLRNPIRVVVKVEDSESHMVSKIPSSLSNFYAVVPLDRKTTEMIKFILERKQSKIIVYDWEKWGDRIGMDVDRLCDVAG